MGISGAKLLCLKQDPYTKILPGIQIQKCHMST